MEHKAPVRILTENFGGTCGGINFHTPFDLRAKIVYQSKSRLKRWQQCKP